MSVYIERFILPTNNESGIIEHVARENGGMYGYVDNPYPCGIFPVKQLHEVFFRPITIFYGGNGSGKSTLLNLIAQKAKLKRIAPHNTGETFDLYAEKCQMYMGQHCHRDDWHHKPLLQEFLIQCRIKRRASAQAFFLSAAPVFYTAARCDGRSKIQHSDLFPGIMLL